ncbi:MAG: glutamate--tRNA ligase [Fidelibacterota bacterium]
MVKTRFAPSPTGYLHVGGLRTALFNYLFAKKQDGRIVLRIEDTDQSRKVDGAVENLLETFTLLGIEFDEGPIQGGLNGPYYQSKRLEIYREHIQKLLDVHAAYPCFCTEDRLKKIRDKRKAEKLNTPYDRHCISIPADKAREMMQHQSHVIRLKSPEGEKVSFSDEVRGNVSFNSDEIDDQVLIKTDGFPTYHFANVVDDHLMEITHVIRGEEWLPSTPKHVLLYRYFGWTPPTFSHLPLLLNPDRSKLSKRQGDVAVEDYLMKGYLPETLLNFVALLGWNPGNDREIFNIKQLIEEFSIDRIQKAGAVFDSEKLKWMNGVYLRNLPLDEIIEKTVPYFSEAKTEVRNRSNFRSVMDFARKRVSLLPDIVRESSIFFKEPEFSKNDWDILTMDSSLKVLQYCVEQLPQKSEWNEQEIRELLSTITEQLRIKGRDLYFPLRLAMYGSCHGPDIPTLINLLGTETAIMRLKRALQK